MPARPRILSGVQPSGKLHLGNYFGAIRQHIALQDAGGAFYFIADYHALTTLKEAEARAAGQAVGGGSGDGMGGGYGGGSGDGAGRGDGTGGGSEGRRAPFNRGKIAGPKAADILAENVRDVALDYLALGLDPAKATFYRQSDVPEVCELAWILSTVTGMGLLERAHSYKDKVARGLGATVGLFTYPVLMAADILIVRSDLVPVGEDQVQHLEMTADMAGYFNRAYADVFPIPAHQTHRPAGRVPGTDGQKMSKSYGNTIDIFAEGKALKSAVMGIVTDSTPLDAPKNPDACTVFALYRLFATEAEQAELAALYRDPLRNADARNGRPFGYGDAKTLLFGQINAHFGPARDRRKALAADGGGVEAVLRAGAERARAEARATMALVRRAVGLGG